MIKFCRKQYAYDQTFNVFMTTTMSKPNFDVNITNHIALVNFSVTKDGLEQLLLQFVVANERADLEQVYNQSTREAFENIKNLKTIEN